MSHITSDLNDEELDDLIRLIEELHSKRQA
jgi:hypothetical protein